MSLTKPPSGRLSAGRHVQQVADTLRLSGADEITAEWVNEDLQSAKQFWQAFFDK